MKKIILTTVFLILLAPLSSQHLINPIDLPLSLSGSFCDLRSNHFHAGIDIRTGGVEGQPVRAVANGYVSRITVSPVGYGQAVYITHPDDSLITVYGHLQRFNPQIAEIVRKKQYKTENFVTEIKLNPNTLKVKQGDIIAYSGNTGSSGGPHLHFETRDLRNGDYLDPLVFYKNRIKDTEKPVLKGLIVSPVPGKGVVNGSNRKQHVAFKYDKKGNIVINSTIEAYGEIGLEIRAADRMNGTTFSYGIKKILMTVDGVEMFYSFTDRFSNEESRYLNSYTDYAEKDAFYIKTFVDQGNASRFLASRNYGIINITEARNYNVNIKLSDIYDNTCEFNLRIKGKKQKISPPDTAGAVLMRWFDVNSFVSKGIRLTVARNSMYNNLYLRYSSSYSPDYDSPVHVLHDSPVPLHFPAQLSLFLGDSLSADNQRQYGIIRIDKNGKIAWIGGKYRDGWIDTEINELGDRLTVAKDTVPPTLTPVNPDKWTENKKITVRIKDDLSGIGTFRGEIDGKYALFEYDPKNSAITYRFDKQRLSDGIHHLKITVSDNCGNTTVYEVEKLKL